MPSRHLHRRRLNRYSKSEQLCSPVLYLRSAESLTCIQACFCLNLIEKPRLSFGISYFVLIVVTVLYIESCPMSDPVNVTYMHMQYVLQYCFKSRSVKPKSAQKKRSPHRLLRGCDNVAVAVPCMRHNLSLRLCRSSEEISRLELCIKESIKWGVGWEVRRCGSVGKRPRLLRAGLLSTTGTN